MASAVFSASSAALAALAALAAFASVSTNARVGRAALPTGLAATTSSVFPGVPSGVTIVWPETFSASPAG